MKTRILILTALILTLVFVSCGEKSPHVNDTGTETLVGADESTEKVVSESTDAESGDTVTEEKKTITIASNEISLYTVLIPENDNIAAAIAEFITDEIKAISDFDIKTVYDAAEAGDAVIAVGKTSLSPNVSLGDDEFLIKLDGKNLYVSYADGAQSYRAVKAILGDTLFSDASYTLPENFEQKGKCNDYNIGDNEFNPFD